MNNSSPDAARLEIVQRIAVGYLPHGLAVGKAASDAELPRVYVGLMATGEVAEVDLTQGKVVKRFAVGHWPRYLTASRDGRRLAVGLSGENAIAVVDLANYECCTENRSAAASTSVTCKRQTMVCMFIFRG